MNSKQINIIVVAVIIIGLGIVAMLGRNNSDSVSTKTSNNTSTSTSQATQTDTTTKYTMADVAKHNTPNDCWTVISNNVYDITSYIPRHKGGDNILSACGKDGTELFIGRQAGQQGDSNNHSNNRQAQSDLAKLQIGVLAE